MTQGRHYRHRGKRRLEGFIPVGGLLLWVGLLASAFFSYQSPSPETAASPQPREQAPVAQQRAAPPDPRPAPAHPEGKRRVADTPAPHPSGNGIPQAAPRQTAPAPPTAADESSNAAAPVERKPQPRPATQAQRPGQVAANVPAPPDASVQDDAKTPPAEPVPTAPEAESSPHVARAQFTTGVVNRAPVDHVGRVFHTRGKPYRRLYYFTRITGLSGDTVTHRWEYEGRVMAKVSFHIGGPSWRVYSSKHLPSSLTGSWRVVVTNSTGKVLKTDGFVYADP